MSLMNQRDRYGWVAKLLHWLLFLLIAGMIASGKYSASLERVDKIPDMINAHKQIGIAVFFLMAFRLLWRMINQKVESMTDSGLLRLLAWLSHWLMYLAVLAQAGIGVLMIQASNRTVFFLDWQLPHFVGKHGLLGISLDGGILREWHGYGGTAIIVLVGVHVLAALLHHFYWDDDTLRRMGFGYTPGYLKDVHTR